MKILNTILWIVSLLTLSVIIFGEHSSFAEYNSINRVSQVLYITSSKILWSLALSFVVYSCVNSYGGFINDFLSWSFWVPLSKLSFCAYLVHVLIVDTFAFLQEHLIHAQWSTFVSFYLFINLGLLFFIHNIQKIYISTGNVFLSFCLAYVASLLFEMPFTGLEKFIFKK
jgi:peptidoglycan/LPS O-acetylase OafA/YrhL